MRKCLGLVGLMYCALLMGQGEGGVFTSQRLAALRTGEGSLGNNPSALNWFQDVRNKTAKLGTGQKLTLDDIQGSVYLDESFKEGTIYYRYSPYGKYLLRYDAFNDEIELKRQSSGQVEALFKDEAISCQINGEEFSYSTFKSLVKEIKSGYLITLFKGNNYTLYIRNTKIFKEGKPAKTSLQSSFPPRFVDDEAYFVAIEKETPFQIRPSKKEILELADAERRNQFKDFLKDRNVNVKEKNGLIRAITFLDKL